MFTTISLILSVLCVIASAIVIFQLHKKLKQERVRNDVLNDSVYELQDEIYSLRNNLFASEQEVASCHQFMRERGWGGDDDGDERDEWVEADILLSLELEAHPIPELDPDPDPDHLF